jgi:ABC-type nickel/cobalt efflux system permease component RcnA
VFKEVAAWFIFVGVVGLLVFSESSFAQTVDWLLWPVRFGLIAGFSALLFWSCWRHRADHSEEGQTVPKDMADNILGVARRWYYGGQKRSK